MKVYEKLKKTEKEIDKYKKQLAATVDAITIQIRDTSKVFSGGGTVISFEEENDGSYKRIEIPIRDWNKIKEKIDLMLNAEVDEAKYEPSKY